MPTTGSWLILSLLQRFLLLLLCSEFTFNFPASLPTHKLVDDLMKCASSRLLDAPI
ncbi:hypothetical protein Pcac1_g28313 [Phytophthora cactorum]|nr:hypothetical protein Pcac1_g28313 [Phytophthora cactorum]